MQNQENKPPTPTPKRDIPDSWAANGRCPACGAAKLKVTHLPDMPDYMSCPKCEISFEVEDGGRYVRLKYIPDALEFVDAILHNRWVEASKLAGIIAKHRPVAVEKKATDKSPAELSNDDVWDRALRMYRLGNSPKMIQLMLIQSGLNQEQSEVISARLKMVAEEDAEQQNQKFWTVAGISLLLVFLLAVSGLYISGNLPVLFGLVTVTPAPTQSAGQTTAVTMLLKLIPANVQTDIMNMPDTTVEKKGPTGAACPATPETAAQLFGGHPESWNRDIEQFPSWQMVSPTDSVTVRVPKGMTAGYLDNKTVTPQSVNGPATIHNVNLLVITCG
jgi:rubredoxin